MGITGCIKKRRFSDEASARREADRLAARTPGVVKPKAFCCEVCGQWHVGRASSKFRRNAAVQPGVPTPDAWAEIKSKRRAR